MARVVIRPGTGCRASRTNRASTGAKAGASTASGKAA